VRSTCGARWRYNWDASAAVCRDQGAGGDVASGTLLINVVERKATLQDLNEPAGYSVSVTEHPPQHQESSTDHIARVLAEFARDGQSGRLGCGG
jgi:hypothetical protein